ncbi:methyltransferase [Thalassobaculum fulvum]|uniref:Methyltransferase n=1 Tax=Thalassobaculum fulvum TaxID=1633335 RepID=A0A919CPP1_9PROT|nr:class I SAM-dependent methyltransferase [Thalassobaculum fulvum]GHD49963.1 methyltransferase [Thalassobaculum fulvum]
MATAAANRNETSPDLAALYRRMVEANRFLPIPRAEQSFVGDGDFRAIGAEFLELFIRYGGLRPEWDVLDLGCGIGRMAIPLTQYLDASARYVGVDVNRAGITWCRRRITRVYPNFVFRHLDYQNPLYNPAGKKLPWEHPLPFEPASFDFVIATSVFTHLSRQDVKSYFRQLAEVLRPGGRLFATFFLLDDEAVAAMGRGGSRLTFQIREGWSMFEANGLPVRSATAFRSEFVERLLSGNGLRPCGSFLRGSWSGAAGGVTYQDVVVAEKAGDASPE